MYKLMTVSDKIRVPPVNFALKPLDAVKKSLEERWEGLIDKQLGVVLAVTGVEQMGEGKILPGDGAIFYPATFTLLTYCPEVHELVKGHVIDVTEFGVFVRVGPVDGMIHVSQIMNDFVSYDPKNSTFVGRESKRVLKQEDIVKARIVSVSLGSTQYKIGLTTRQPGLGAVHWVADKAAKAERSERSEGGAKRKGGKEEKKLSD